MHKILMIPVSAAILLATGACATTDRLTESGLDPGKFNAVVDGCPVALYTLVNRNGCEVCVTNYGGRVVTTPWKITWKSMIISARLSAGTETVSMAAVSGLTVWSTGCRKTTSDTACMAARKDSTTRCGMWVRSTMPVAAFARRRGWLPWQCRCESRLHTHLRQCP